MELQELLLNLFSEKGVIYGLFVFTFILTIYKGIPFLISKFDEIVKKFADEMKEQRKFFQDELKNISDTFINKVTSSDEWHRSHHEQLSEIRKVILAKSKTKGRK